MHLLADERGAVVESVVSRLHRLVESRKRQVRIVAFLVSLPSYDNVARFTQISVRGIFSFYPETLLFPLQQPFRVYGQRQESCIERETGEQSMCCLLLL